MMAMNLTSGAHTQGLGMIEYTEVAAMGFGSERLDESIVSPWLSGELQRLFPYRNHQ